MRNYLISRLQPSGEVIAWDKTNEEQARRVRHIVIHSPTGFEFGYGGSGPADLALAILADFLGAEPHDVIRAWKRGVTEADTIPASALAAVAMHQDFKWKFISLARPNSFSITGDSIARFISDRIGLEDLTDEEGWAARLLKVLPMGEVRE